MTRETGTIKRSATTMSLLAVVAGLVGMVAFLAGPAAAGEKAAGGTGEEHDSLTSGDAYASEGSVASGSAVAINGSTASGDAVAIDGSVGSGCSTASGDSTASGACDGKEHGHEKDDAKSPEAKPVDGDLALTGFTSSSLAQMALVAFFSGTALLSLTNALRRRTA